MNKKSAGILLYRFHENTLEVFLVHPGGPFWATKDKAAWSIPKGEFSDDEDALEAAKREFTEETGIAISGDFFPLTPVKQKSKKKIYVFSMEKNIDAQNIRSNAIELEWPPKSGKKAEFPEVDRGAWFPVQEAKEKIHKGQIPFIDELVLLLKG